jgi:hypothetical protein
VFDLDDDYPTCRADVEALAARERVALVPLRVLSPDRDPFFCGTEAHRQHANWFAKLFSDYRLPNRFHLRRLHYILVSQPQPPRLPDGAPYQNTERCYVRLNDSAVWARHLALVDPTAFDDRRNPDPHLLADYDLPDGHCDESGWSVGDVPAWALPRFEVTGLTRFELPAVSTCGYDYSLRDQPVHLELWVEKSTVNDVLVPVCRAHGVNLVTNAGMASISGVVQMLLRIRDLPDDRPTRIGYVSDFDPAGDCMPVAVARQVEFYISRFAPGRDVRLTPVALTADQVRSHNLPRIPIKDSDTRKAGFEDRHGEGAVELDALEALAPGELERLVEGFVSPYRDATLEGRMRQAREAAEAEVERAWEEATREERQQLDEAEAEARTAVARYDGLLRSLNDMLAADLIDCRSQLERAKVALAAKVEGLTVGLPPRPAAEVAGDRGVALYDSARGYMEQLWEYKKYRGTGSKREGRYAGLEEYDYVCSHCGKAFHSAVRRRASAAGVFCGLKCRLTGIYERRKQPRRVHDLQCDQCGKPYQTVNTPAVGRKHFCCADCRRQARRGRYGRRPGRG